jgi:hypothetical protein
LSEPLRHVSGLVAPHQLQQIEAIGGTEGISSGLRTVVSAGLLALQSDVALLQPVEDLQSLVDRLAKITGRTTPAGAWWAPTREALPTVDQLDPAGAVLAMPRAVTLLTDGTVTVDLANSEITASLDGHEVTTAFDLHDLAAVAALLPAALAGLAGAGPGRRDLGHGLAVERTQDDLCRISLRGIGARCAPDVAQTFAAELLALQARAHRASAQTRQQLNRTLQVTP